MPTALTRETLEICASSIRDTSLLARICLAAEHIIAEETVYSQRGSNGDLFRISATNGVLGVLSTNEMVSLYNTKLSKKGSKARHIYDALRISAEHGICPLCGQRTVTTLDHYLAKTTHPTFAVTPANLVPSCGDCNKIKQTHTASDAGDQTLHPYFDDANDGVWLVARVTTTTPPAILFLTDPPSRWSTIMQDRVRTHFNVLGLSELYSSNAAQELAQNSHYWEELADTAGSTAVRDHLLAQAASRRAAQPNAWQTAMYEALAKSQWFWGGGHREIDR